jgi:hypothetical protein
VFLQIRIVEKYYDVSSLHLTLSDLFSIAYGKFTCEVFSNAVSTSDNVALNGWMDDELESICKEALA